MNILSWNCRGAGNFQLVRDLVSLVQAHSSSIVFLCETRKSKNKRKRYRARLGFRGFDALDSVDLSGGLALYWHESLCLDVKTINERYIDAYVTSVAGELPWRLTCVYGEPRMEDRHCMWSSLRALHQQVNMPWVAVGDFNEAMWSFEHFSATPRSTGQMIDFHDVLEVCGLGDLGFAGLSYTYDNRRAGRANVKVRLDGPSRTIPGGISLAKQRSTIWWPPVRITSPYCCDVYGRSQCSQLAGDVVSTRLCGKETLLFRR